MSTFLEKIAPIIERVRSPLYRNSLYILGATAASAVSGFIFWMIAARVTTPQNVGATSAALGSVVLLKSLGDFGLAIAMIYFASSRREHINVLINTVVAAGWVIGTVISVIFVLGTPIWAPGLTILRADGLLFAAFVGFTAVDSVLALQDAAMLSKKRGDYVFWRNIACNIPPILLILIFTQLATNVQALFLAYTLPNLIVGLVIGTVILPRHFEGYRFFGRLDLPQIRRIAAYGLSNHSSNVLWGIPAQVIPIIAVSTLAGDQSGYFLMNWTVFNFLLIIPRSVTTSMFVEGSHHRDDLMPIAQRSLSLILLLSAPLAVFLWFFSPFVLQLFGEAYAAPRVMQLLLLSVVPFAVNSVCFIMLRVQERLFSIILFAAVVAGSVILFISLFTSQGNLTDIAQGWLIGNLMPALVVVAAFVYLSAAQWMNRRRTLGDHLDAHPIDRPSESN